MYSLIHYVILLSALFHLNAATKIEPNPIIEKGFVPITAQRRQGYEYSSSIIHHTPGDTSQHAQSEVKVNLNTGPTQHTVLYTPINYQQEPLPTPLHLISTPQSEINEKKLPRGKTTFQTSSQQGQNAVRITDGPKLLYQPQNIQLQQTSPQRNQVFNVGYSIGFAAEAAKSAQPYNAGNTQSNQVQVFRNNDIVTGTPTAKVQKPVNYAGTDVILENLGAQQYVMNAMESYRNQKSLFTPAEKPQNDNGIVEHRTADNSNKGHFTQPQIVSFNSNPSFESFKVMSTHEAPTTHAQIQNNHNEHWENLGPNIEIATGQHTQKHPHVKPISVPLNLLKESGHGLITNGGFDHVSALDHSLGFDYTNAMGLNQKTLENGKALDQNIQQYVSQNQPEFDKKFLESFYKQYKIPVSVNTEEFKLVQSNENHFKNPQVIVGTPNFGDGKIAQPSLQNYQQVAPDYLKNGPVQFDQTGIPNFSEGKIAEQSVQNYQHLFPDYLKNSQNSQAQLGQIKFDPKLLQSSGQSLPIKVDTSLLQKAIANSNHIASQLKHGYSLQPVYMLPGNQGQQLVKIPQDHLQATNLRSSVNLHDDKLFNFGGHEVNQGEQSNIHEYFDANPFGNNQNAFALNDNKFAYHLNEDPFQNYQPTGKQLESSNKNNNFKDSKTTFSNLQINDNHNFGQFHSDSTFKHEDLSDYHFANMKIPNEQIINGKQKRPIIRNPRLVTSNTNNISNEGVRNGKSQHEAIYALQTELKPPPFVKTEKLYWGV